MKQTIFLGLILSQTVLFTNCKKGDQGPKGDTGKNSLVRYKAEPAGTNCAAGGVKIETGIDTNGNGVLDDAEVTASQTKYICNGVTGPAGANGQVTLTKTTNEPAGSNCGAGGVKIEVGVDANNNGTLDASEVLTAMTRFICNGSTGLNSLVRTTAEPAGANCTYGGVKFESGLDANKNGLLDNNEVTVSQTQYVCNGAGAIYSDWIDVNMIQNDYRHVEEGAYNFKQVMAPAALTADIVNKGIVLMYYKSKNGLVSPVDKDDVAPVNDADLNGNSFSFQAGYDFQDNYLAFLARGIVDITRLNDNGSAIRYVLVPGYIQGRTVTDLKKMTYQEVAAMFNIKD